MLIIADVAGELDALTRLIARRPDTEEIILLGDLVDRGPDSAGVVAFAMNTRRVRAIKGNHEHMMVDYWKYTQQYEGEIWKYNGGIQTIESYMRTYGDDRPPETHLTWLNTLPIRIETEKFIATHAPIDEALTTEFDIIWNRDKPKKMNKLQIFGHNSHWGLRSFFGDDGKLFALCLDQSRDRVLTALDPDTMEILEEPY